MLFTLSEPGVRKDIAAEVTEAYIEGSIFEQFIGTGSNAPIKTQNETGNLNGLVDIRLRGNIRTGGVKDNEDFNTNEGDLINLYQQVILETHGNSVRSGKDVKLLNQTQFINFRDDAKDGLTESETDKLDRIILSRASADCTCVVPAGHRGEINTTSITATDYATVADVRAVVALAKSSKNADGSKKPKVTPYKTILTTDTHGVQVKRKIYLMFVGEATAFNLKQDPAWAEAQQAASDIGLGSPIFTGQLGVIDDCVLMDIGTVTDDYAGIYTSADTGFDGQDFSIYAGTADAKTEINILMGATAMVMPMDDGFNYYEDTYDMKRKAIVGIDRHMAIQKARFKGKTTAEQESAYHNKDFGVIAFVASAAKNEA
uniref:hypothetical protein n=1 Tax=Aliarcobacter sp. TaxID=2321116 RepID=UPI004047F11B